MAEPIVCASGVNHLMDHLEGLLPPPDGAMIEEHVTVCERCQAFLASYHATSRLLRDVTDIAPPPGADTALLDWLRNHR